MEAVEASLSGQFSQLRLIDSVELPQSAESTARAAAPAAEAPDVRAAAPAAEAPDVRAAAPAAESPDVRAAAPAAEAPDVRAAAPAAEAPDVRTVAPAVEAPDVRAAAREEGAASEAPHSPAAAADVLLVQGPVVGELAYNSPEPAAEAAETASASSTEAAAAAAGSGELHKWFGKYTCPRCQHRWTSANSWNHMIQVCSVCYVFVFPRCLVWQAERQRPRRGAPHPQYLCEMCWTLGYSCTRVRAVSLNGARVTNRA